MLKVVIANDLSFKISTLTSMPNGEAMFKAIKKKLTHSNPDFLEAVKWGRSTTYPEPIPAYLYDYAVFGDEIFIDRGRITLLKKIFAKLKIEAEWNDCTQVCAPVKIIKRAVHSLRPDQVEFITKIKEALKKLDIPQGMGLAGTSFGKTFSVVFLADDIAQPILILVHTRFMQKQWIEELVNNFGISKKDIGGAGGIFLKKPIVKSINVALYHSMSKKEVNILFRNHIGFLCVDEVQKASIKQFKSSIRVFRARYRLGFSANHVRKDGKTFVIEALMGDVLVQAAETESNSKIFAKIFATKSKFKPLEEHPSKLLTEASQDLNRNILIARCAVRKHKEGKIVIIFVERKEQAGVLAKILSKFRVYLLIGPVAKKALDKMDIPEKAKDFLKNNKPDQALDEVKKLALTRDLDFVIVTQKGEVGLSVETFDHGIVTTPIKDIENRFNQLKGRLERQHKDERLELFGPKATPTLEMIVDDYPGSYEAWTGIKEYYAEHVIRNPYLPKLEGVK